MMKGGGGAFGPCQVTALRVSAMTRARETADIIASHLDGIQVEEPDPRMNEGRYVVVYWGMARVSESVVDDAHQNS